MSNDLDGRVAVITAAASGMGREASLRFAAQGAHVVAVDRDGAALERLAAEGGRSIEPLVVDMTDLAAIDVAVAQIGERHGRVDALWNHVGAPGPRGFDFDAAAWERSVSLNLTAPIFLTKAAWPLLEQARDGASILFTASVSALIASRNSPVYSALKSGVVGFMRCMAAIGGPRQIRANALCPGTVETPMLDDFFGNPGESRELIEQRLASYNEAVPLGRTCKPEEVADLAAFLAGPRAAYITGVAIPIDGGYVAL